jgi:3-deoxy-D-manno-octulosonic-acid transferase
MTLARPSTRIALRSYLLASHVVPLFAPSLLKRRLARRKEDAHRWREKLGVPGIPRPEGTIVWLHAVGLGEVLSLRGLISEMGAQAPDLIFLVTSSTQSSATVFTENLPARCLHQFLPLDAYSYVTKFLDYWRPALSIWAEQEVWPGLVTWTHARGVPLALVNARITAASHRKRMILRGLYADLFSRFSIVSAQDAGTAERLGVLGASDVRIDGAFKASAPPLYADMAEVSRLRQAMPDRPIWVAASTHPGDEVEAIAAVEALPDKLLIIVPRDIRRADEIATLLTTRNLPHVWRSSGKLPTQTDRVWLADSYGELGLWYRLATVALIGGGFDRVGGHNPWEAAALGAAILHGPDVANFQSDYAQLNQIDAARPIMRGMLSKALNAPDLAAVAKRALAETSTAQGRLAPLARDLLKLLPRQKV